MADPNPFSAEPIDVLIGADLFSAIIQDGVRKGTSGQPVAQSTIFGWVLSGSLSSISSRRAKTRTLHCVTACTLDQELRAFWEVEEVPRKVTLSPEDQRCEEHFKRTHSRKADGRYQVRLPFKQGPPILIGESRHIAEQAFRRLQRRLHSQPHIRDEYVKFMREYTSQGHMRPLVDSPEHDIQAVYLPHHPVIRESSSTTRLRVVFNASCPSSNATSLNDHMLTGAKLQTDLVAVILRWRMPRYVLTADIEKMYRQILVDPRDVDYQRVVWAENNASSMRAYQLLTVTYGQAAAPFLALRVIQQLVLDDGNAFPMAVPVLRDHIYVDDVLFGADDLPTLRKVRDQVRSLLQLGQFTLRKWAGNSPALLSDIVVADHAISRSKSFEPAEQLKILGVDWNPGRDAFQFKVTLPSSISDTKRSILSVIARIFDPLGWVTPATVKAKIFLQTLWQLKLGWDETLPAELLAQWASIQMSLADIDGLTLSRWVGLCSDSVSIELHGFADASSAAYAAAIYIRLVSPQGEIATSLLLGKSRVAPVKSWTIPRLELAAAVLMTRAMTFVIESLRLSKASCYCWTDSSVVLAWLDQHPTRWRTFVANRVAEIQSRLPGVQWRHVPTKDNPADCASRGLFGRDMAEHSLWWTGPTWLRLESSAWPSRPTRPSTSLEEKTVMAARVSRVVDSWDLGTRFSSWRKLVRVTAYIMRFVSRARHQASIGTPLVSPSLALTAAEYERARDFWLRRVQAELFPEEQAALQNNGSLKGKSSLVSLRPFVGEDKLIRVGGRIRHSSLPFSAKHPIVLADHPISALIIADAHRRALHSGPQLTLATLRQEYWILRARSLVRSHIHRCVPCTREAAAIPLQVMGDLPRVRVERPARAFQHCGVDYAGPISVRAVSGRGIPTRKAYIAIFICMATRAVHLELVAGYATPAFLAALSRFCSRRGLPSSIYSDNGTTFVGADRELSSAFRAVVKDPAVQNRVASDCIEWHFIPPAAPHFGGLWEAGVKSVKHHLRRVVGAHALTFEELNTLLCNIEACLNSRPIGPLSDSLDDYSPLTPGHFLVGSPLNAIPEPSLLHLNENRLSRWQLICHMSERFWQIWSSDYINTLQQRVKWRCLSADPVKVGRLVLLRNPVLPPCKWELGRVTQCHPGSDSLVRVVTVKTADSEYVRPLSKLCLLPTEVEYKDKEGDSPDA